MNPQAVHSYRNKSVMEDDNNSDSDTCLKGEGHEEEGDNDEKVTKSEEYSTSFLNSTLPLLSSTTSHPAASSLYSSMKLPIGCLREQDGCDEAELRARAERCQEIMKLYEQAKKAEAERVRIANIKPLVWAKPTFDLDSDAKADTEDDTTAAADETKAEEEATQTDDSSGKRKGHQDEAAATATTQHYSSYHRERFLYKRRRESTPEEVQAFVEFANKWIPSQKGASDVYAGNDDKEETEGEETKSEDASS